MIDISVSYTFEESCYEDPLEKCLAYFRQNFDIDESLKEVNTLLNMFLSCTLINVNFR